MDIPTVAREAFSLLSTATALRKAGRLADAAEYADRARHRLAEATAAAEVLAGELRAEVERRAGEGTPPRGAGG